MYIIYLNFSNVLLNYDNNTITQNTMEILNTNNNTSENTCENIISLGCCCEPTFVNERIFNNKVKYPFDWLSIHNAKEIAKIIRNNFSDFVFTEPETVLWRSRHNKDIEFKYPRVGNYCIHDVHGITQETMNRRIERFRQKVKNNREYILFFIKCHLSNNEEFHPYASNMSCEDAKELRDVLREYKGDNNFTLLVVNENDNSNNTMILREECLLITSIYGPARSGDEGGSVVVPCDYSTSMEYMYQWKNIFSMV